MCSFQRNFKQLCLLTTKSANKISDQISCLTSRQTSHYISCKCWVRNSDNPSYRTVHRSLNLISLDKYPERTVLKIKWRCIFGVNRCRFLSTLFCPSLSSSFHIKCPVCGYGMGYKPVVVTDILMLFLIDVNFSQL